MRTVIAEDSVLLLAGLTKLLETTGFEVAAAGEVYQQHKIVPDAHNRPSAYSSDEVTYARATAVTFPAGSVT